MSSHPQPGTDSSSDTGQSSGTVMVVEDLFISNLIRTLLVRGGFHVVRVGAQHAIEMLKAGENPVDLVITNTPNLFLPFRDRIPMLYLAATPDLDLAARFHACRVLRKPFHAAQLIEAVGELAGSL